MDQTEISGLTERLYPAFINGEAVESAPSDLIESLAMTDAYKIAEGMAALKREAGHESVGRKVGFANKAMWRLLKLESLVWGYMWNDTVSFASEASGAISLSRMHSPRIEPEVVLKLSGVPGQEAKDGVSALAAVEWMALGFEINDCIFPNWKFKPADFVAVLGFHKALVVGEPVSVTPENAQTLADQLAAFKLKLYKGSELAAEGAGKNSLRSPALCLIELANLISRQESMEQLHAGELISTGTLTDAMPIRSGEEWRVEVEGIDLPGLTIRFS